MSGFGDFSFGDYSIFSGSSQFNFNTESDSFAQSINNQDFSSSFAGSLDYGSSSASNFGFTSSSLDFGGGIDYAMPTTPGVLPSFDFSSDFTPSSLDFGGGLDYGSTNNSDFSWANSIPQANATAWNDLPEMRAYDPGFLTDLSDFGNGFNNATTDGLGNLYDSVGATGDFVTDYVTDSSFRNQSNQSALSWLGDTYSSASNYVSSSIDDPSKPFSDVWDWAGDTVDNVADSASGWYDGLQESSEYGSGAEYLGESTANATGATIAIAAGLTPLGRGASTFNGGEIPNYRPEEMPNEVKLASAINPTETKSDILLIENLFDMNNYGPGFAFTGRDFEAIPVPTFNGIARSSEEMFDMVDAFGDQPGSFLIDRSVNKSGLLNYLTRSGDQNANNQEYGVLTLRPENHDSGTQGSYAPTLVMTNNFTSAVYYEHFEKVAANADYEMNFLFHNHPSGSLEPSPVDLENLNTPSQLLGTIVNSGLPSPTVETIKFSRVDNTTMAPQLYLPKVHSTYSTPLFLK